MRLITCIAIFAALFTGTAVAGGERAEGGAGRMPAPSTMPRARAIERSAIAPIMRPGDSVGRNLPLPAPVRPRGYASHLNEFYGPTYYYPSAHNQYEGLHPQYYPFLPPDQGAANYKVSGIYCPGRLCGSSRSHWYWDSYDDWKRGGRYEQHQ